MFGAPLYQLPVNAVRYQVCLETSDRDLTWPVALSNRLMSRSSFSSHTPSSGALIEALRSSPLPVIFLP
jgi:hypothetical protein